MNSSFIPFMILMILVIGLVEWYTYTGIQHLISGVSSARWRTGLSIAYWALLAIQIGCFVFGMLTFGQRNPETYQRGSLLFSVVLAFLVPKMIFSVLLMVGDLGRLVEWVIQLIGGDAPAKGIPGRRKFFEQFGLVVASIPFVGMLYGIAKGKYDYQVRELTLKFPDLPPAFEGLKLAQISDVHSGSFDNPDAVQRGIDLIQQAGADLIVFTGDLVNNYATEIEPWIEKFATLTAPMGLYSITGNHDYGDYGQFPSMEAKVANFELLQQQHQKMGFRLLMNEHVTFEREGQQLSIVGVENWGLPPFPQHGDLNRAVDGAAPFKILLSHDPSHWDAQVVEHEEHFHLTLSGHTHGMQFGVEIPGFRWSPVKYRYPRWADLYERAGQYLYVNRGFGFIGFSGRVGIWPEITVINFERA